MASEHAPETQASTRVYLQEACLRHQFIRSKDSSNVVERPQRLRAINIGLAAMLARLETRHPINEVTSEDDELVRALNKITLTNSVSSNDRMHIEVVKSSATVNLLNNPAVKFVHGDVDGDEYLENLIKWTRESRQRILEEGCELPEGMPKGDLYLCPTSVDAIQGALGTVCEAINDIYSPTSSSSRAFVAVRPPGHHCGEDTPAGFCFVNNVVVGAAHAHLQHNAHRAVIFDIDLHHGNGTQSLIWQINEETYRHQQEESFRLASPGGTAETPKPSLQVFYGSLHDVLSYPCEDGEPNLVQAASVSIHGPHGQYIENIHLLPYSTEEEFWSELYDKQYSKLFDKASNFVKQTARGDGSDVLVFVSCGFDASEHEYASMSRHGRHVPTSFYRRFARDALAFAERHAQGRLVSVLEGGYSDRALTSGVMSWLAGLAEGSVQPDEHAKPTKENETVEVLAKASAMTDESWWSMENLISLEKATKKRRGGRTSVDAVPSQSWLRRSVEIFSSIDISPPRHTLTANAVPPLRMALRDRSKKNDTKQVISISDSSHTSSSESSSEDEVAVWSQGDPQTPVPAKKIPRVILKLGPAPKT